MRRDRRDGIDRRQRSLIEESLERLGRKGQRVAYAGRAAAASPATGLASTHAAELKAFLETALSV